MHEMGGEIHQRGGGTRLALQSFHFSQFSSKAGAPFLFAVSECDVR